MTELYCEFAECVVEPSPSAPASIRPRLVDRVDEIRRIIAEALTGRVDVGLARIFQRTPAAAFVEFFFEESSLRNQLSRMIEEEAECAV